jgi:hypothetical protein
MNIAQSKKSGITRWFPVALVVAVLSVPVLADHRPNHKPSGGGGGDNSGGTLSAKFCLLLADFADPGPGLGPDTQGTYCDSKKDKVIVSTGSNPGFRFDSNSSNNEPNRTVLATIPGFGTAEYEVDLRFNQKNGGLDLGAMQKVSEPNAPDYYVPVNVNLDSPDGLVSLGLAYSQDADPLGGGYLAGDTCVRNNTLDAKVTRIADGRWTVESNPDNHNACLWDKATLDQGTPGTPVEFRFHFEIWIK